MSKEAKNYLVGLSGGADSTYTALILKNEGHHVQGAYLKMFEDADPEPARKAAEQLGIPFHLVDCTEVFEKEVLCHFANSYLQGLTPNPCVQCNRYVKIAKLCELAKKLGADHVLTGHYGRIEKNEAGRYFVCRAENERKDQSYMLWGLSQEQLAMLYLPLSDLEKERVRAKLQEEGLSAAQAKDSMDICFLPEGNYASFIKERVGDCPEGDFVNAKGEVLGRHKGILHYTVGQRKHLGITLGKPMFVSKIDPKSNRITLVPSGEEYGRQARVEQLNFQCLAPQKEGVREDLMVKMRYGQKPVAVKVVFDENGADLFFEEAARAITPGQSAVFYLNGQLAFGGYIMPNE